MWNRISAEFYRLHSELSRIFLILWTNIGIVEREKNRNCTSCIVENPAKIWFLSYPRRIILSESVHKHKSLWTCTFFYTCLYLFTISFIRESFSSMSFTSLNCVLRSSLVWSLCQRFHWRLWRCTDWERTGYASHGSNPYDLWMWNAFPHRLSGGRSLFQDSQRGK